MEARNWGSQKGRLTATTCMAILAMSLAVWAGYAQPVRAFAVDDEVDVLEQELDHEGGVLSEDEQSLSADVSEEYPLAPDSESDDDAAVNESDSSTAEPPAAYDNDSGMLTAQDSALRDIALYDLDGSQSTMSNRYGGTLRYIIVGRPSCGNTKNAVNTALELSQQDAYAAINFIVLDVDDDRDTFSSGFAALETNRVRFYSPTSDSGVSYNNWAWNTYFDYNGSFESISLPFTVLVDETDTVLAVLTGSQSVEELCRDYLGVQDPGMAMVSYSVCGHADTVSGRELLPMVNSARAAVGVSDLVWDTDLEEVAIQRAAEIAVYYSHTRPDGTTCFTAWPDGFMGGCENIAFGYANASEVNTGWTNSSGHYANMINSSMRSFGAACFIGYDGLPLWVECFSGSDGTGLEGSATDEVVTRTICERTSDVSAQLLGEGAAMGYNTIELEAGDEYQLVLVSGDALVDSGSVQWVSDNAEIATVSEGGLVSALSGGDTVVRAQFVGEGDAEATQNVKVTETLYPVDYSHDGWVNLTKTKKGYVRGGKLVTGWLDLDGGAKHYFDENGFMLVGWNDVEIDGKVMHYYFHPSGNLARNTWATIDGKNYYFRPSGNMATGWATISDGGVDKKYYFLEDGTLVKGTWHDVVNDEGVTNHYYFRPSGSMATEWAKIDGRMFFFRPSGNMATGFADVPDDAFKRYFDDDGTMVTGWREIGGNTHYFRSSGAMQTGSAVINGQIYTFSGKGVLIR